MSYAAATDSRLRGMNEGALVNIDALACVRIPEEGGIFARLELVPAGQGPQDVGRGRLLKERLLLWRRDRKERLFAVTAGATEIKPPDTEGGNR